MNEYKRSVAAMLQACKKKPQTDRERRERDRTLKHATALVELLETTYKNKCCVMFDKLQSNLSSPKKHLDADLMRVYSSLGDNSVTPIFRILQPKFLKRLVGVFEWLMENDDMALAERILNCVIPYIKQWITLIDLFAHYYHDKNIGKNLKNLFTKLQGRCKWFASEPVRRIKEGRILGDDYKEAWEKFTDYYATRLPLVSGVVYEYEAVRLEIVAAAHKYFHERLVKAYGDKTVKTFNCSKVILEFYNDKKRWEKEKWIINGVRQAYGANTSKTMAGALRQCVYNAFTPEERQMYDHLKANKQKVVKK